MALLRIFQAIKKMTQAESDTMGLSPVQIQALLFTAHTRSDVATVGNLANMIGTTHVTAVKILNGLVRRELIKKAQKAEDRRVTLLSLTVKGKEIVNKLDNWGHLLEDALLPISEDLLRHFETALDYMVSSLQKKGHLVVSEPCLGCIYFLPNAGDKAAPHYCQMIRKYLTHEATLQECPEHTASIKVHY
ncbi:MarR family winged helix-turn-helix transcriptional regulator [Paenibacillus sp. YPG26]|uniref:MarR family winged helix-turn-helix transcriptional regulator n=1 Tax=Paenibacillus sp. YPG26 TaxID=2878915 RepID=UPI00204209AA|nr:MarR family winged helix-turn-helix transcriptional regulator [Paenibacillus sp. YPG26]USB32705.1 MarR family winged helix-turn-helix transcriptional regulator [Paenibacillus sp. YPG26]